MGRKSNIQKLQERNRIKVMINYLLADNEVSFNKKDLELEIKIDLGEKESLFKEKIGKTFQEIYKIYHHKLSYYVFTKCGDKDLTEDIVTESFVSSLEKIEQYDNEKSNYSTWLYKIALNITRFHYRTNKKAKNISLETNISKYNNVTTLAEILSNNEGIYIGSDDEYHELVNKKAELIVKNIYRLKEPYKTIIHMREIENKSYQDIADILDMNLSTLKSTIRNGRLLLQKMTRYDFKLLDENYL